MIDVVADKPQNSPPLSKEIEGLIEVRKNIVYDEADPEFCSFDIYRIPGKEKYPVLFYIHGGGFVAGDKRYRRGVSKWYAAKGICVFNVNYGLCPKYCYPEPLAHLVKAMNKACEMTNELNLDIDKFFVSGDSAGAYLCVYLAAMRKNAAIARAAGVPQLTPDIAALGLISGMFYTTRFDNIGIFLPNMVYGRGWRRTPFREYIDPENLSLIAALPPCFLVTARGDFLRHYSRDFAAALKKKGLEAELLDMDEPEKLAHAFAAMLPETAAAQRASAAMADFLKAHI